MTKATRKSFPRGRGNRQMLRKKTLLEGAGDPVVFPVQNSIPPDIPHYVVPEAPIVFWLGRKIISLVRIRNALTRKGTHESPYRDPN